MALKKGFSKPIEVTVDKVFLSNLSATEVENIEKEFKAMGYGNVSSFNSVDLISEVQGKLSQGKVDLKTGVKFRKGDLLYKIYDVEARYALRARKSGFINLIATILPDIKSDYANEFSKWSYYIESIKLNKNLPELPAWTSDKEKVFLSSKQVLSEYFSIKGQEEQLKKYSVYAPFNGTISQVYTTNYSVVNPGSKVIKVAQNSNFEISISIPTHQIESIKIGSKATILTTENTLKGYGKVVRISDVLNQNTQSINVFVKATPIDNQKFIEGEYVKVDLNIEGKNKGMIIPSLAIKNSSVMVFDVTDSLIHQKQISILNEDISGTFISGLTDGEIVITQEVLNHQSSTKYNVIIK
jgi:hypothetical protein